MTGDFHVGWLVFMPNEVFPDLLGLWLCLDLYLSSSAS